MIKVNIYEMKVHFSRYLKKLRKDESILITKRNVPVAEIRLVEPQRTKKRPVGLAKGEFTVPPSFFEPLPEDVVEGFSGRNP